MAIKLIAGIPSLLKYPGKDSEKSRIPIIVKARKEKCLFINKTSFLLI